MHVTNESAHAVTKLCEGLESGSFLKHELSSSERQSLFVTTFNIRYAGGSHLISGGILRHLNLARTSNRAARIESNLSRACLALKGHSGFPSPDVLALQEADNGTRRAGGRHIARELAERLGVNYVHASMPTAHDEEPKAKQWYLDFEEPVGSFDKGATGLALLSRVRLLNIRRIELPWTDCPWRPRLALAAKIPLRSASLNLFNLHIDPHGPVDSRLEQLRAVLDEAPANEPIALVGDFNTLSKASGVRIRNFLEEQGFSTPMPNGTATWRAGVLRLHTDWIFVRRATVARWGVLRLRGVSDHWPVWAEIFAE